MATRINTLWCLFNQDNLEKPSAKELFEWLNTTVKEVCTNFDDKLVVVQCEPNGFYLKFSDQIACDEIIQKLRSENRIKSANGNIIKLTISYAGFGLKRVRVLRLPTEVPNHYIKAALGIYGEILDIEDEFWSTEYSRHSKIRNGNRVVNCRLTQHIPSFIMINGSKAMITYDSQPKTCAYCGGSNHLIAQCEKRINKCNPSSYSNALMENTINTSIQAVSQNSNSILDPAISYTPLNLLSY